MVPLAFVTNTLAVPALPVGVVQVMLLSLTTVTLVAAVPPMVTAVAPVKFAPVIVTLAPPLSGPLDGEMEDTVGAGMVSELDGS